MIYEYDFAEKSKEILKLSLYPMGVFMFDYLHIDQEMITILCILIGLDSVCGGVKAYRLYNFFSFRTFIWGIILKIMTLFIPATVALLVKGIGFENSKNLVSLVIGVMIISEGYSIFGNIYSARKKIEIKKIDAVSMILSSLRKKMYSIFQIGLREIEKDAGCGGLQDREDEEIDNNKKQL